MKKKTAYLGVMLALALICSYVEVLIPIPIGIPGIKLGLANIVIVFALYSMGIKEALVLSIMRVTISGFMFGNVIAIAYSLAGGLLSLLVMYLLKKTDKLSCISISIAGGIFHNIGQMIIATILVDNYYVLYYVPVLMIAGFITGACIGVVAQEVFLRIGKQMRVR
ncbi:MAG: Gx transporter family protein [Lachnospiraceae bacterium]|nr:Gx transporter family protein [Lachnospiraceae bacterium]